MRRLIAVVLCGLCLLCRLRRRADVSLPALERIELANGTVLLLSEKHDVPLIGLEAIVRGGAVTDPDDLNGLASLLAELMQHGAGKRDAAEFAEAVESVGGQLTAAAGLEAIYVSADFMSRDAELMIELVADMLQRPLLDADELTKIRERSINLIRAAKGGDPGRLLPDYGHAFLFGSHPYGNPVGGSEATLATIDHDTLRRYYDEFVGGDRLIISLVGDFDIGAMKARLAAAFGDWRGATAALPQVAPPSASPGRRVLLVDKPGATQSYFWIGNIGVAVDYPRRAELDLANTVFGGRFTSMLNTELRVKAGLTYGVYSMLLRPAAPGAVAMRSSTETATTTEAIDMALRRARAPATLGYQRRRWSFRHATTSWASFRRASRPPRKSPRSSRCSSSMGSMPITSMAMARHSPPLIAWASTRSSTRYTRRSDNLVFVLIGDAARIRDAVGQYGRLSEMSIDAPRFRQ